MWSVFGARTPEKLLATVWLLFEKCGVDITSKAPPQKDQLRSTVNSGVSKQTSKIVSNYIDNDAAAQCAGVG
jgi:hypothetical protein